MLNYSSRRKSNVFWLPSISLINSMRTKHNRLSGCGFSFQRKENGVKYNTLLGKCRIQYMPFLFLMSIMSPLSISPPPSPFSSLALTHSLSIYLFLSLHHCWSLSVCLSLCLCVSPPSLSISRAIIFLYFPFLSNFCS